jgi:hypothetical protein
VLAGGGLLMGLGALGVSLGAGHVGSASDPWPVVPGSCSRASGSPC